MTYPQVMCILTRGKSGEEGDVAVRAKRVLADFRGGRYSIPESGPETKR
jgi:hypothetical protein